VTHVKKQIKDGQIVVVVMVVICHQFDVGIYGNGVMVRDMD
jgi:hypothetical protein